LMITNLIIANYFPTENDNLNELPKM